jgi:chemotaxis protein methyltransferase CheR
VAAGADDAVVADVLEAVRAASGVDFRGYAPSTLRRRLDGAAAAVPGGLAGLRERLLADPSCVPGIVAHLCVGVTAMFRDPAFHRALRERAVPLLRDRTTLRVWHAGCATGEEVWSTAIVLEEEGLGARSRLYGTDVSAPALEVAQSGILPIDRMREYTANYHASGGRAPFSRYYAADGEAVVVRSALRRRAVFAWHDLAADGPIAAFDVVLCRNVLMYFGAPLQARVQALLAASLRPGGVLALGHGDALVRELAPRFAPVDEGERIFRRLP